MMKLVVSNNAEEFILFEGIIEEKTKFDRIMFATGKLFMWLCMAGISVLIPIAHFILVPSFLIISIIAFKNGYRLNKTLVASSPCVCCKCKNTLSLPENINEDSSVSCENCFQRYKLFFEDFKKTE